MWNGDHAMKIFTFLKSRVLKDLKIFINEEYYCQMRRIMMESYEISNKCTKEKLLILQHYSFKICPILYHKLKGS